MIVIPHKAKQFLLVIIKLLIVCGALYYIYDELRYEKKLDWSVISTYLSIKSIGVLSNTTFLAESFVDLRLAKSYSHKKNPSNTFSATASDTS